MRKRVMEEKRSAVRSDARSLLLFLWWSVFLSASCDAPKHAATPVALAYAEALQYGDVERAFALHVLSVDSPYCSERFVRLFERLREQRNPQSCAELLSSQPTALSGLEEEARLYLQILHVLCREPAATCRDYAKEVFAATRPTHQRWRLIRLVGDGESAIAYFDIEADAQIRHLSVPLRNVDGQWKVDDRSASTLRSE